MNIDEIRQRIERQELSKRNAKEEIVNWLSEETGGLFTHGLTLMPKKVYYKHGRVTKRNIEGIYYRHLSKHELEERAFRFVGILNKLILKSRYTRFNNKLPVVMTIEGERTLIDLHAHFAINKPSWLSEKEFSQLVNKAIRISDDFCIENPNFKIEKNNLDEKYRYKLDLIDDEWMTYITKDLDKRDFHNLYLP